MGFLKTILVTVFGAVLVIIATPVSSQILPQLCAPRDVVVNRLKKQYAESRVMLGTAGDGAMMIETYANKANGSWSLVTTTPQRLSCLVMAGKNWHATKPVVVGLEF